MVTAGLSHAILEATSHGLAQHRVSACDFDLGVVTNITHEHLDYHGSYEAYRFAKARLFTGLAETPVKAFPTPRAAVLNRSDSSFEFLAGVTRVPQLSYGQDLAADVRAESIAYGPQQLSFIATGRRLDREPFSFPVNTHLVGAFNLANCLAAISTTVGCLGLPPEAAQLGTQSMPEIPGRMERVDLGQDFTAIVDFAHTPNALERALEAGREMLATAPNPGRLVAVFGSAGLRDRLKRRMMAEIAAGLADLTVLTAEDPRTESLSAILEEMAEGMTIKGGVEGQTFWRIPDRREALRYAVGLARPGDLVMVCGKGHEQSMCFGEIEYSWDDRIGLRAALAERLGINGPEMPFLPDV
jgi:UDP-N-acetylmuramoyl-L-alanyl-D-glutamate--2,6-diaminopimelate ligase